MTNSTSKKETQPTPLTEDELKAVTGAARRLEGDEALGAWIVRRAIESPL